MTAAGVLPSKTCSSPSEEAAGVVNGLRGGSRVAAINKAISIIHCDISSSETSSGPLHGTGEMALKIL